MAPMVRPSGRERSAYLQEAQASELKFAIANARKGAGL